MNFTDEQKEYLKNIRIPLLDIENCYITDTNQVFTPLKDKEGRMIKTGEQAYEEYLNPPKAELTEVQILKQQLLETQNIIAQMQYNSLLNTK